MGADLGTAKAITGFNDPYFKDNVAESIAHAWYDGDWQRHPYEEETVPKHTEPLSSLAKSSGHDR